MIQSLRKKYNSEFTDARYNKFIYELDSTYRFPSDFRICETPLFVSDELTVELKKACDELVSQLRTVEFNNFSSNAIPEEFRFPNEDKHPTFLQIDFAICLNEDGTYIPKLIELQGFPSLYGFQYFLPEMIRKHFDIPKNFTSYFNGYNPESYSSALKEILLDDEDPQNVILLEITPELQKTRIDFAITEQIAGIKTICITDIIKRGNKLFYKSDGSEILIKRIYNRVIIDELVRKNIKFNFNLKDELDVKWVGHPNWFFKISKYILPFLKGKYVPNCFFLNDLQSYPEDLQNYVLKPLYSFAGLGVEIDLTKERLDQITERHNYILQQKINYAPLIETPDEPAKVEIRMMYLWKDEPVLVNNLIRTSKGKMMGVDFNKNKVWIGASSAFHSDVY